MDFFGWTAIVFCFALGTLLALACLIQVGWVARTAARLVRTHLPRH